MTEIDLKNGEWGAFTTEVLSAMNMRLAFQHIEEKPFPQVAEWKNWAIISDIYDDGRGSPVCEQLVMTNSGNKRNTSVSAIRIRNMNEFNEQALTIEMFYTDTQTMEKRIYAVTVWDDEHFYYGPTVELNDTEKDGLLENLPPQLQNFHQDMDQGKRIGSSLRTLIETCSGERFG